MVLTLSLYFEGGIPTRLIYVFIIKTLVNCQTTANLIISWTINIVIMGMTLLWEPGALEANSANFIEDSEQLC